MEKKVNKWYLERVLDPIGGENDKMYFQYKDKIDVNNEAQMRQFIQDHLKDDFEKGSQLYKKLIRLNLSYYLTTEKIDFRRQFECILPPIPSPDNPKEFFVWIWREFFPNEDWHLPNTKDYIEINEMNEPWKIYG